MTACDQWWEGASLVAQTVKNLLTMREIWIPSLGQEDLLEKEMATHPLGGEDPLEKGMAVHSNILAWRVPWTEEPGRLPSDTTEQLSRLRLSQGEWNMGARMEAAGTLHVGDKGSLDVDGERGAQEALLSGPGEFRAGVQLPRSFVLKVLVLSLPMCSCATLKQTFRLFQPQSSIHIRVSQTTYDRGVNFLNLTFANICLLGLCTCHSHHPLPIIQVSVEM